MNKINTVAIIGLGAIGAYFADKMLPHLDDDLRIIAGGDRKKRLEAEGLIVNGKQEYYNIVSPDDKTGYADLVIVIPKFKELSQALCDVKNQVGPDTVIMTPLNGVESEDIAAKIYGKERILYSLMRVSSVKDKNKVSFNPDTSFVEFGDKTNDEKDLSENVRAVKEFFDAAGIKSIIRADMELAIWEKFVCNVSENQVSALMKIPFGAWGAKSDANAMRLMAADEVIKLANKKGIKIADDYAKDHLEFLMKLPKENMSSTLQDILAGRKTEVDMFAGTVIKLGKEYGVPTPVNEFLYHAIRLLEDPYTL
ncbi:MAG: ketopantoate reductase family protein [Lachnospiraceae bacterium]|nr:ketopantoate reductase family protein [Lachnospiraceae bacterium]